MTMLAQPSTICLASSFAPTLSWWIFDLFGHSNARGDAMSCRRSWLATFFSILLVSGSTANRADLPAILGDIHAGNDRPVGRAEVSLDGAGTQLTSDSGKFRFALLPPLKVGFAATFHVPGWVVTDPFVLARGRTYLPAPEAEPIAIRVLRPGDSRLKSANNLAHLVEEEASHFETRRGLDKGTLSLLKPWTPEYFGEQAVSPVRMIEVEYHSNAVPGSAMLLATHAESNAQEESAGFLAIKARELGFTTEELKMALIQWSKTVTDPYHKGLAALYNRQYALASEFIYMSLSSAPAEFLPRYVPLARAEYEQGHYPAAEAALRKVLAVHGEDPIVLNNLSVVLEHEAKYSEAESLATRALAINEKAHGLDDKEVGTSLNNLALIYADQGKYAEAVPLCKRALVIAAKRLEPEDPNMAVLLGNLAALYYRQGKFSEGEPLFKRALAINEKALGQGHPQVAIGLNNLALLYQAEGKYADAEPLLLQALTIDEKALGPEHPQVAVRLNNLGLVYRKQGRYAEAESLYKRALAINEKAFGSEHPEVARNLNNLALLCRTRGRYAEAESLYRRALAIDEKVLGPEHPEVATIAENLAFMLRKLGRKDEAKVYEMQATRIRANNKQKQ
jgi:tetratricopeptide (TPR) repeat protein